MNYRMQVHIEVDLPGMICADRRWPEEARSWTTSSTSPSPSSASTNKVVIHTMPTAGDLGNRIVLMPVNRNGEDIYTIVNDKPGKQIKRASDVLRWIAQNLYTKKEARKLAHSDEPQ